MNFCETDVHVPADCDDLLTSPLAPPAGQNVHLCREKSQHKIWFPDDVFHCWWVWLRGGFRNRISVCLECLLDFIYTFWYDMILFMDYRHTNKIQQITCQPTHNYHYVEFHLIFALMNVNVDCVQVILTKGMCTLVNNTPSSSDRLLFTPIICLNVSSQAQLCDC